MPFLHFLGVRLHLKSYKTNKHRLNNILLSLTIIKVKPVNHINKQIITAGFYYSSRNKIVEARSTSIHSITRHKKLRIIETS